MDSEGQSADKNLAHEAYMIQKRDLKFDKPLILNLNDFRDFSTPVKWASYYRVRSADEIAKDLSTLLHAGDEESRSRLSFLRSLGIKDFDSQFDDPEQYASLAASIADHVKVYCEDVGANGVPAAIQLLKNPATDLRSKIGAIRCLQSMTAEPFKYTYSQHPTDPETASVVAAWRTWWNRSKNQFAPLSAERRSVLAAMLPRMEASRDQLFDAIDELRRTDLPFFAELLLGDSPLATKAVSAVVLKQFVASPLRLDVPLDASPALVDEATANWVLHYELHRSEYEPGLGTKLWHIVADTQYAYMVERLVTFQFGRSALRTHEPVSDRLWNGFVVSAPLMFTSELLILVIAVPLGLLCAVKRGTWTDRGISMGLFFLYSIPPFVAAMLFLLYFCYGDYFSWFPSGGLHSDEAASMGWGAWLLDYAWHAFLPIVCLSLFSLAATAMYGRSSMLDVINQDYIRTARAKGLPPHTIVLKHVVRNGLIPILTIASSFLPAMLGGSVLIEVLFNIPGLGRLGWDAIDQKDIPTLMALLYLEALVTLFSFLVTDLLYVLVDPRISFSSRGKAA
jgi:ABC-type dipeptide/oligopeptide/nickel transport system permease component